MLSDKRRKNIRATNRKSRKARQSNEVGDALFWLILWFALGLAFDDVWTGLIIGLIMFFGIYRWPAETRRLRPLDRPDYDPETGGVLRVSKEER